MSDNLNLNLLATNEQKAQLNRKQFDAWGLFCINVMSSPGAGKTILLEKTLRALAPGHAMAVLEGDMTTQLDADRLGALGIPTVAITTGRSCHLDATMVAGGLQLLQDQCNPASLDVLWVENVGNLACPAEFTTGEHCKLALLSVTEGEDKPLKYPVMFHEADCVLITKIDLLPHVPAELECIGRHIRQVNGHCSVFPVSALTGAGLGSWWNWLEQQLLVQKGHGHHQNPQGHTHGLNDPALMCT